MRTRRVALLVLLACRLGFSWGKEGHWVVVRIAESLLTPAARAQIAATLEPGETLPDMASWADQIRGVEPRTGPWHYVDIPLNRLGLDMARDCPKGACVVAKIAEFREKWHDPAASPAARREALLFLIHLVGDLHQPLHCEDNHDDGGNDVRVRFLGEATSLHALWDTGLLRQAGDETRLLDKLARALTPRQLAEWPGGTVEQWADESHRLAQGTAYGLLPAGPGVPQLGLWYFSMTEPVIELQLAKAGVRLAAILNQTFP